MRKYISFIALAFSLLALASCAKVDISSGAEEDGNVVYIDLRASTGTKAETRPGTENERKINSIHYFFYDDEDDSTCLLMGNITCSAVDEHRIGVNMDEGTINNVLFPRPKNTCKVYVILNLPSNVVLPTGDTSLENIKRTVLQTNFKEIGTPANFVMQGEGTAEIVNRSKAIAATGIIYCDRLAAKLTIGMIIPEQYELKDEEGVVREVWKSSPSGLRVSFNHIMIDANVGADPIHVNVGAQDSYSKVGFVEGSTSFPMESDESAWACQSAFYSYPEKWDLGDDRAPYLAVTLPWAKVEDDGSMTFLNCYYKVLLAGTEISSNNWYNINVRLGVLGSFKDEDDAKVTINESMDSTYVVYYVHDWREALSEEGTMLNIVEAEIKGAQYLVVPVNEYNLYNLSTLSIPFQSSNDCFIDPSSIVVTKMNYSGSTPREVTVDTSSGWTFAVDNENFVVRFSHDLNNDVTSKQLDISEYNISFRLGHVSAVDPEGVYYEDISIVQYPSLSVVAHKSNGVVAVNGSVGETSTVYNSNRGSIGSIVDPTGVTGTGGNNNNQYQYVVTVSVLPDDSDYYIGDPRTGNTIRTVGNLTGLGSNYRPAAEDTQDVIAPKFRIASSYGKTQPLNNYTRAQERCAAYQENGYPAGRWRLPTHAEIEYLVTLSNNGLIDNLFSSSYYYWAAGGDGFLNGNFNTPSGSTYARCVYDEWYWVDGQDEAHLTTWGGYQTALRN